MSVFSSWTTEAALAVFDDHLLRVRGLCTATRANYARWVRVFLDGRFTQGRVEVEEICAKDVMEFLDAMSRRLQPRSLELVASSLRSFFRFLRSQGLGAEGLENAVPMVPRRRSGLVRHLTSRAFNDLIASLGRSSARDLRERAIILCMARLGLRTSEVCRLRLDDIDWRQGALSVRARKNGHGARLPITAETGRALAEYLQHGRPDTPAREVFVLLRLRRGAPISRSIVKAAVGRALRQAGIEAPTRGGNLLRHSLATELMARGARLVDIAGLFGHRSLATTRIYAAVDVDALRGVALPWPGATS
ncbi:MAG TPA: tyrosine-type recombinase/integrase [Acidimicrobiales bacterium]|nr:tyrosine-type recombinase/integrase [Acidimicrobiales bacterium]